MDAYQRVLAALLEHPDVFKRGLALTRSANVVANDLYFNLLRLEALGWVESQWDLTSSLALSQRVQRLQYRLTALGRIEAERTLLHCRVSAFVAA